MSELKLRRTAGFFVTFDRHGLDHRNYRRGLSRSQRDAKGSADENVVWVTETWDSQASHDASLTLPAVKNSITQAKPLIAGFQKVATTTPVAGVGLPRKSGL